ncbi:hypothetical protein RHBI111906_02570 [Rhodothermus bifroesti]|nr:hypothetical protein HRbin18_01664 [bacterium HR18]
MKFFCILELGLISTNYDLFYFLFQKVQSLGAMETRTGQTPPWPQQVFDNLWLLAGAAIVFFVLSYLAWGMIDLLTIPVGGAAP